MSLNRAIRWLIIGVNTLGMAGFLFWLIFSRERIFYTQEGILYFLPFLPFFFVYFYVFRTPPAEEDIDD